MPDLIVIYWRDIPAQVLVRAGRAAAKRQLAPRFQEAIDRAAMRAGARDTDAYLADWRRADPVAIEGELEALADQETARLEAEYDAERLQQLVRGGGRAVVDHLVFFAPSGKRGRFAAGTDLLGAARHLGVDLDSVCGGRGICGRCAVTIGEGAHAKLGIESSADAVTPPSAAEERYAALRGTLAPGRRLACQARLCGDVVVDVPADSQVHRQVVRKSVDERPIAVDPVVHLHYVEVAQPDMNDPSGDARRLLTALGSQWGLEALELPLPVLHDLQKTLRNGNWAVTAAVRHGHEIVALFPGFHEAIAGIAVDIGSTTIAAHLCDLASGAVLASAGVMNPQIRFGEDLMSRVSYVMMNPGGREELTRAVRGAVDDMVGTLTAEAGIARGAVCEMTVVGNPIMHHLFLGLDPTELGGAPFALAADGPLDIPARDVGVAIAPGARIHVLPCIAGHVGADAAGVILAEAPHRGDEVTLVVDIGTNAEIVLGNRERLLACSSPTGPAFEGAQISSGQRAAPGAIERVRIDPATLEPRFKLVGSDLWSDDQAFHPTTRVTGICGSGIIEVIAEMLLAGIVLPNGTIDGSLASRTNRLVEEQRTFTYVLRDGAPRIAITQNDVRAVQLAKAALYAGTRILMDRYGVAGVTRIKLAGAFGAHIDPLHALVLGLVPDCPLKGVTAVGNAAGHGARIALLDGAARKEIAEVVRRIEKVETALEPSFQRHFVDAMALPHATDAFPNLAQHVRLPDRAAPGRPARRRPR